MEKTVFIPEGYFMFFACGHIAQRKVKVANFERLKALLSQEIKDSFLGKVVFTQNEISSKFFYIENGEITAYPNFDYEKLFYQYKDEMIKNIESTFKTSYYHAEGILNQAKQKWKRK